MKKGNCYESNGKKMLEMNYKRNNKGWFVCHGEVTGQKGTQVEGVRFGHCWLEKDGFCFDYSNGKKIVTGKEIYYRLGKVKNVVKYNGQEFVKKLLETENWGSWHDLKGVKK